MLKISCSDQIYKMLWYVCSQKVSLENTAKQDIGTVSSVDEAVKQAEKGNSCDISSFPLLITWYIGSLSSFIYIYTECTVQSFLVKPKLFSLLPVLVLA